MTNRDELTAQGREASFDITAEILRQPWRVVMIDDGHILPCFPTNLPDDANEDIEAQAEQVIRHATENGYGDGSFIWTTWYWNEPQIGEFGYVELAGYWEYRGMNPFLTALLTPPKAANPIPKQGGNNE